METALSITVRLENGYPTGLNNAVIEPLQLSGSNIAMPGQYVGSALHRYSRKHTHSRLLPTL